MFKRLMFGVIFGLIAVFSLTAEAGSWTITTSTTQDKRLDRARTKLNTATCATYSLAPSCTQNQARTAFCALPGSDSPTAPCTVNGVSSGTILIYSTAGEFVDKYVIGEYLRGLKAQHDREDVESFENAFWAATENARNAACIAIGLPAGCR